MANKLYLEENYVIWEVDGTPTGEYSKNHCVYRETTTSFIIKEEIDDGIANILKADVDAGNWLDGSDVAYTTAGLRTWLRTNSGFKTASGGSEAEFIILVKTDNAGISASNQFIIPTATGTYNYDVDWGDGNFSSGVTSGVQHTYASAGTYTIKISGLFPRIYFNGAGGSDAQKLLEIQNWGIIAWGPDIRDSFEGCVNMQLTANDVPDLSGTSNMLNFFNACTIFTGNNSMQNWDVSTIGNLNYVFQNTQFNIDISSWNTNNLQNMRQTFQNTPFNHDISSWNVSKVATFVQCFFGCSINQNLGAWNLKTSGTNLSNIFNGSAMSIANYTDTLVGWANNVFVNGGPLNTGMANQIGMTFDTSRSGGANFATAGDARTYLTTATPTGAGWTISGDTVI